MVLSDKTKLLLGLVLFIVLNAGMANTFYSYTGQTKVDFFLYSIFLLLMLLGLWKGMIVSLGLSLLVIFVFGSAAFWMQLTGSTPIVPFTQMIIWQGAFLFGSFVSGFSHSQIESIMTKYNYWSKQYHELVTIDPETGFDNEKRFFFYLNEQFKRAQRYEQSFSLLLVRIKNWKEFEKYYGSAEADAILAKLAENLKNITRGSDSHFRVMEDTFALIFPETNADGTEVVINKIIEDNNKGYALKGKNKMITLTLEFGAVTYHSEMNDYMRMFNDAMDEVNRYIS
ncbi:diguanylate cyclase [Bacillus tianshenii]|nr:diguanylate cyclase [Bacillus tianshenii]